MIDKIFKINILLILIAIPFIGTTDFYMKFFGATFFFWLFIVPICLLVAWGTIVILSSVVDALGLFQKKKNHTPAQDHGLETPQNK